MNQARAWKTTDSLRVHYMYRIDLLVVALKLIEQDLVIL